MNDLKTSLYSQHIKLEAKMASFAGYVMPINYKNGLKFEYKSIRENVGMFDVSHMGQIFIKGPDSIDFLQYLTTNNINNLNNNCAQYSTICNHDGGIIDDIIVYKFNDVFFLVIINASNIDVKFDWFSKNSKNFNLELYNNSKEYSMIALQGPNSRKVLSKIIDRKILLDFYTFCKIKYNKSDLIISRTGYTGELGFEIIGNHDLINEIWEKLLNHEVAPCGLGVRDILRMEMKYCLYGNDISEDTNPIEAGLKWIVDLSGTDFIGKSAIDFIFKNGVTKNLICFIMEDRAIPRKGYNIKLENEVVGITTSGIFSPGLNAGIGLSYIKSDLNINEKNKLFIEIRNKMFKIKIIKPPFIKNTSLHK